ncbi:tyrosine-protein phosphatase non-receptor type 18 [Megalops cyprinoides]|uniref:tyrosine-protein phosphatase non-receptor type 18 n=1 Tax=Megalops cyprinoides TaxID=118141 RepID=UPI001863B5C1|nr:tyrosine-protein phosphatase non-receptor type 18 [Megalops cyprinoides]
MDRQLMKFVDRVKSLKNIGSGGLDEIASEYSIIRAQAGDLKGSSGFTTEAGQLKDNVKKNRYKDILPYDQTRVPLSPLENESESDYINASFIQGAIGNKQYIATQGPLSHTLGDFWRMVWQYNVKVIIMACREIELGKRKCERYWSSHTETSVFGAFAVTNLEERSPNEEVVIRTLLVKYQDETRTITQFQYTAWPDHGIPCASDGILGMMVMVRKTQGPSTAPILIHCSAGCGRTGVICTVDYVHDLLLTNRIREDFSIMEIVMAIRRQRPSAVQTKEQYEFVYHTVGQMFEKALLSQCNNYQNLTENRLPLYDDVYSVKIQRRQTSSCRAGDLQPKRKSNLLPQTSHPLGQKMNDTYAVVNKPKHRPPPESTSPLPTAHHYDNADLGGPSPPADALYSTVKPKNRCSVVPASTATYDRVIPASDRGAEASVTSDQGNYELVQGVFSTSSRNTAPANSHQIRRPSEARSSTDDDYEYISNPLKDVTSYCSPGSMGFNCRIKKPKGPRDPPAEWSRAER